MRHSLLCLPLCLSLAACAGLADPETGLQTSTASITMTPADAEVVLALVNYPGTDAALLDTTVGLDRRAAAGIVAFRVGADGVEPSSDDGAFTSIAQLDAVPYVGDAALLKLQAYAIAHPVPAPETVEGVAFAGWQSQAVVWGVNGADAATLDALLDRRAVSALIAARPFTSVAAMGPVAYVGSAALKALRGQAPLWWSALGSSGAASLAGSIDGVSFDEATAATALEIANQATAEQLTAHAITSAAAAHLLAARPYASLAQVAATSGVGPATMTALRTYAQSGAWGAAECLVSFDAAVQPQLASLLFMSESDRPLQIIAFPGAGGSAPTAASVLLLVGAGAGTTAETRGVDGYYAALEPADSPAAAAVQAAVTAQLTDVVYVAVHKPDSDPYHAEVDVYLLGRTSCGDLVGLHAIAVET